MHYEPRPIICMEKQLGWAHKLGRVVSGNLQGKTNSVSQVDGVSNMAAVFQFCGSVGGGFRKGAMVSAHSDARHFSSSLYATGTFQPATPVLELRGSKSD